MAYSRAQKIAVLVARAERRLQFAIETVHWELDELAPKIKEIGELEMQHHVEIEVGELDEGNPDPQEDSSL